MNFFSKIVLICMTFSFSAHSNIKEKNQCKFDWQCGVKVIKSCCGVNVEAVYGKNINLELDDYKLKTCDYVFKSCEDSIDQSYARKSICKNNQCELVTTIEKQTQCWGVRGDKSGCFMDKALKSLDPKVCHKLGRIDRHKCLNKIAFKTKSPEYCPDDSCIIELAIKLNRSHYCNKTEKSDDCFIQLSRVLNDKDICHQTKNKNKLCLSFFK